MDFRYARHTTNLEPLIDFYTRVIGLEILGDFKNHSQYDGVFLGHRNHSWHLEFTVSNEKPNHACDPDDLLVFYVNSAEELQVVKTDAIRFGYTLSTPKNPYWLTNGIQLTDPDGFGVIITVKTIKLDAATQTGTLLQHKNISYWGDFLDWLRSVPYGRNSSRAMPELVITESCGTCSSKHALAKKVAVENNIPNVQLIISIYKMTEKNMPGIGSHLSQNGLEYIPEAHCYLKVNGKPLDLTNANSSFVNFYDSIMEEHEINFDQVDVFKVELHKNFMRNWIRLHNMKQSFDEIWEIRERCIHSLSESN
ncbi:MAG TPA: VOC family protein [Flavobacteriales bacterium]|nr:VOC family protein [Flavobacteriales bacterium]